MTAETKNTVSLDDVRNQIAATLLASLNGTGWYAVRVSTDGRIYESHEPSPCYGEDEYFQRTPHTATVYTTRGEDLGLSEDELQAQADAMDEDWYETNAGDLAEKLAPTGLELL